MNNKPERESPSAKANEVAVAKELVRQGRSAEAEARLRASLRESGPDQRELLHTLAELQLKIGKSADAVRSFEQLAGGQNDCPIPGFWTRFGHALQAAGQHEEAIANFNKAIDQNPQDAEAICRRGMSEFKQKRFDAAHRDIERALEIRSDLPFGWLYRGHLHKVSNQLTEALKCYERASAIKPSMTESHINQALLLTHMKRFAEALAAYDKVLDLQPEHVDALLGRAQQLQWMRKHPAALQSLAKAHQLAPLNARVLFAISQSHLEMGNYPQARKGLERAIEINPNDAQWHFTHGNLLRHMGHIEPSVDAYDRAIALKPSFIAALNNRGRVLQDLNLHQEAIRDFKRILEITPDYPSSDWHIGFSMLAFGLSKEGLVNCEARHRTENYEKLAKPNLPLLGEKSAKSRKLLVQWEQRFGDIIQMARYIPIVEDITEDCWWQIEVPLQSLFRRNFPKSKFVATSATLPPADHRVLYTSLPLVAECFSDTNIPGADGYLKADSGQSSVWKQRIESGVGRRKVAVVWRGNAMPPGRSLPVEMLSPLFELSDIDFYSIQRDINKSELDFISGYRNIQDVTPELVSFDDTASLLAAVDLCLTVDTAVAHLAGALSVPTWILLKYGPDWRWQLERTDSPWYSSARLFRQPSPENWGELMPSLVSKLQEWASDHES